MLPAKTGGKAAVKVKGALARTIKRFVTASRIDEPGTSARIGFIIDATGSRSATWREAQKIQAGMFRSVAGLGPIAIRLVHFGGNKVSDRGWMGDAHKLAATMRRVDCAGGLTCILPSLRIFIEELWHTNAIILVGDAFEEDGAWCAALAEELKARGIKVFAFLEGQDEGAAMSFQYLAATTGGKFARFGSGLPLKDLCEGVALLAAGGEKAINRLANKNVKQLLLAGPVKTGE